MNTVSFPILCYEAPFPERLPAVSPGCREVAPEVRKNSPAQASSRSQIDKGRQWNGAFCHEHSGTGILTYEAVSRMGIYYRGLIVDCRA